MSSKNLIYAQSGGVTPVINATAASVIETVRAMGPRAGRLLAARDGILGILDERLVDTACLSEAEVLALGHTPGGVFGSCRHKLPDHAEDPREYQRIMEVFRAHDIGCLLYNGGNDSADTALKLARFARQQGHDLQCIAVPKTIDNDLAVTDNSPGFGSVAKYVAVSILEASLDVMAMASSSTRVFILEVMGRHAGWIAAAGGLVAEQAQDPPQIIVFPEIPFDTDAFCARVRASVERNGYCSIVVSEGARTADGRFLAEAGSTDAFGHKQLGGVAPVLSGLVTRELGYKCHWAVADYLQRSARHLASAVDVEQARAVGRVAVELALEGQSGVMPVIRRISDTPYRWDIEVAPLGRIANKEKKLPRKFITASGFGITAAARRYLAPLIQGQAWPVFRPDGLPHYIRPELPELPRKLPTFSR